ncbi:hypothetical protein [Pinibacter soli]|uniref:DUF3575 domain-containing protein n=1 Tax=Pinibacter soli TaxID=3044211 RepID=A0ABT6RDY2_9BACT|nr:hypothetical protein [Pinibacter soli]MDI3320782.1 hypothetical protein [Pinibacter soli]
MKPLFVLVLVVYPFIQHAYAQEIKESKTRFVLGLSLPELIHAGVTYRFASWSQLGVNAGVTPAYDEIYPTISLEHRLYFGNKNPKLAQKTWFCRQGGTYLPDEVSGEQFTANLTVGKDLVFRKKNGMTIDAGVYYKNVDKSSHIYPALRVEFFISAKPRT